MGYNNKDIKVTQYGVSLGGRALKLGHGFKLVNSAAVYKVWGGRKLASLKNLPSSKGEDFLGETWEVSVHSDGPSLYENQKLSEYISDIEMPYLVKLIDTSSHLSVQVHPGDEYAKEHENSQGKTECWVILGSEEGSGIYLGLKEGVKKADFENSLKSKENMDKFLVFYPVKRGDFFYVPAGSIHAIGSGVFLAEVQQSSGITYRVWDWNRVDSKGNSRELHIEKAMQVINFKDKHNDSKTFKIKKDIFKERNSLLVDHPQFNLRQVTLEAGEMVEINPKDLGRAKSILNLEGSIEVDGNKIDEYQSLVRDESDKSPVKIEAKEAGSLLLVE
ncbi:MAG: mannose-6-phosphate isomerase [Bacteriovoracaceae bacterium]|jgi:mannose-6-phosphate isomerase